MLARLARRRRSQSAHAARWPGPTRLCLVATLLLGGCGGCAEYPQPPDGGSTDGGSTDEIVVYRYEGGDERCADADEALQHMRALLKHNDCTEIDRFSALTSTFRCKTFTISVIHRELPFTPGGFRISIQISDIHNEGAPIVLESLPAPALCGFEIPRLQGIDSEWMLYESGLVTDGAPSYCRSRREFMDELERAANEAEGCAAFATDDQVRFTCEMQLDGATAPRCEDVLEGSARFSGTQDDFEVQYQGRSGTICGSSHFAAEGDDAYGPGFPGFWEEVAERCQ